MMDTKAYYAAAAQASSLNNDNVSTTKLLIDSQMLAFRHFSSVLRRNSHLLNISQQEVYRQFQTPQPFFSKTSTANRKILSMYIIKAVTVSSTAIIATITANPLRTPGPSDTPIFSVVSPPTTTASVEPTAAIRPISVPPKVTVTTTAMETVTVTASNNGSPYPAFNASNYPHQNFTTHPEHHHKNVTNMMPVIYSNCTNTVPVFYTSGNQTVNGTIYPSNPKASRVEIICEGRRGKNETKRPHASGVGGHGYGNSTGPGYVRPSLPVSGGPGVPYVGGGGRVDKSMPAAEEKDENGNLAGQGKSSDEKAKRAVEEELSDEHVLAYVKALEKGPVV